jgi:hypothetical protein
LRFQFHTLLVLVERDQRAHHQPLKTMEAIQLRHFLGMSLLAVVAQLEGQLVGKVVLRLAAITTFLAAMVLQLET